MKLFLVPKRVPKTEFNCRFAERLRLARRDAGIKTAKQMADLLGVEVHTYRTYERADPEGNRVPPISLLPVIAELTGQTVDWLLTGRSPLTPTHFPHNAPTPTPPPTHRSAEKRRSRRA